MADSTQVESIQHGAAKDVSARMVAAIEIGRAKPSLGTLEAIAAVFGMSLRELLSEWSQPAFAKPPAAADDVLH